MSAARTGTSWDLVFRNVQLGRTLVTDKTADVAVLYALTHRSQPYLSGAMAWEAHDYEDAWVVRFTLPATPGILVATVTASATIDGATVSGSMQTSVKVE